jgi:hypothetical protein
MAGRPLKRQRTWAQDDCDVFILAGGLLEYPSNWEDSIGGENIVCGVCRLAITTYLAVEQRGADAIRLDAEARAKAIIASQAQTVKQVAYVELGVAWAELRKAKEAWANFRRNNDMGGSAQ